MELIDNNKIIEKKETSKELDINDILKKFASGYKLKEKQSEYTLDKDGKMKMSKQKVNIKEVAPDIAALKALINLSNDNDSIKTMTDEELIKEKNRLLEKLK